MTIPIQNIYYMLAYAFKTLRQTGYKSIAGETFKNAADLCAEILIRGVSAELRRGLNRAYTERTEALTTVRGRVDIAQTLNARRGQIVCTYDAFLPDTDLNRILKTTMTALLGADIAKRRRGKLRRLLFYFKDVLPLDISRTNWNIRYDQSNQTYRALIGVCYLILNGLIHSGADGTVRVADFDEANTARLYEKFILAYYKTEWPALSASAAQIPWALDDGTRALLPRMNSDITLRYGDTALIVDAKYYSTILNEHYGKQTLNSANLYQIFTYVKNTAAAVSAPRRVSGLLLYAGTDEGLQPDANYQMSGNTIGVKTLDLQQDFSGITAQLDAIVTEYFGPDIKKA